MNLSIITINNNNPSEIITTCNSIDCQQTNPHEHIIIASNISEIDCILLENTLKKKYRKFYFNIDKSLYNAMNIGIEKSNGDSILFLNSGDVFYDIYSISRIYNNLKPNTTLIFRTIQQYNELKFIRPSKKYINRLLKNPGHQGFVAPLSLIIEKSIFFDENKSISSDGIWMKNIINNSHTLVFSDILTIFNLGGISNTPNLKTIKIKFCENGIISSINEFIKFLIYNILGKKYFYFLISYINKYEKY